MMNQIKEVEIPAAYVVIRGSSMEQLRSEAKPWEKIGFFPVGGVSVSENHNYSRILAKKDSITEDNEQQTNNISG